jgi:hypothetical protein
MLLNDIYTMNKPEVDSILLANLYLTKCKLDDCEPKRIDIARKYLTNKINKVLVERSLEHQKSKSMFTFIFYLFIVQVPLLFQ